MRGFTLIELLVVVTIFALVASLVLANYPKFAQRLSLERTAQEVSLSLRKAQSFALGVREFGTGSGVFPGYGVRFEIASPKNYYFYADANNNKNYDAPAELVELWHIETSPRVVELCAGLKTLPSGVCGFSSLDITYTRPNPTVTFKSGSQTLNYSDVEIKIAAPDGIIKTIAVWTTGQVAIE